MDIEHIRKNGWIIFECISGSKSYGLDLPTSDTDIKGVYILPKEILFGLNNIPQINNESNDIVFYELGRFVELLSHRCDVIRQWDILLQHCYRKQCRRRQQQRF